MEEGNGRGRDEEGKGLRRKQRRKGRDEEGTESKGGGEWKMNGRKAKEEGGGRKVKKAKEEGGGRKGGGGPN